MKRSASIPVLAWLLSAVLAGACGGSQVTIPCVRDRDCPAGSYCADDGVCRQLDGDTQPDGDSSVDGDTQADGDTQTDGDTMDGDYDAEQWEQECEDEMPPTLPPSDCRKSDCRRVAPPECWRCDRVADPDQDGDPCERPDDGPGFCDDGVCRPPINDGDDPVDGDTTVDGDTQPPDCLPEGGRGNEIDQDPFNDRCCAGLARVSNAVPGSGVECAALPDGSFYCARCPNGECGPGENWCRCPDDCAAPGECRSDGECPADECSEPFGGPFQACLQTSWSCNLQTGECLESSETLRDQRCNEITGSCEPVAEAACVAEAGGLCAGPEMSACPGELLPNWGDDLGCGDATPGSFCCLANDCVRQQGYCTLWQAGCDPDFEGGDLNGCPYGRSGLCCLPKTASCVGLGRTGQSPMESCCPGLSPAANSYPGPTDGCIPGTEGNFICLEIGDQACDTDAGENRCNSADCAGGRCTDDASCPASWCEGFSGRPDCIQHGWSCQQGSCVETGLTLANALCNPESGYCEPMADAECLLNGGYCTIWQDGCRIGYAGSQSADQLGCPGGRSALCCLPYQPNPCGAAGGFCIGWGPVCPDTHYTDTTNACDYGQCCMPVELGACAQADGYCQAENLACRDGFDPAELDPQNGCPDRYGRCCLPATTECVGLGLMAIGDQRCCPGLEQTEYAFPDPSTGECVIADCACWYCLELSDNLCDAAHNENYCNSESCERPAEQCRQDSDCLQWAWNVECIGHWDCRGSSGTGRRCAPVCGLPCGNGRCEPDQGESMQSCFTDCGPQPACAADRDCLGQTWDIRCLGHWDCGVADDGAAVCQGVCGEPCGNDRCEPDQGENGESCPIDCRQPEPACVEQGGHCESWSAGCSIGFVQGEGSCDGMVCAGGCICCLPDTADTSCAGQGGVCTYWWSSCPAGYADDYEATGCSFLERCCAP